VRELSEESEEFVLVKRIRTVMSLVGAGEIRREEPLPLV
jgi:hypothetical protein